jgi:hypothetical protein
LKRNRTDARAVCQIGRSNGFSPGPDRPLAKPRFPPTGVSVVSATLTGHHHIGVAAPATETDQRSRALQEPPLLLGIIESRPPRRISGDNIGRSREINFRDSRPWAAGLPILEVDPVASEAVKVLLPLVEVLLSAVPPDADLWGALTVQKTPVRVEAAADIAQTSAAPGVLGEEKIPVRGWWERRIMGIARGRPRRWRWWRNHWHTTDQQPKRYPNCHGQRRQSRRKAHATMRSHERLLRNS